MSSQLLGVFLACLVSALVVALVEAWRVASSACQWFLSLSAYADRGSSSTSSLPGEGGHDGPPASRPQGYVSSQGRHLSSPPPDCCASDHESDDRDPRTDEPHPLWLASPLPLLAAIDPTPDFSAFGAGVELIVFVVLFTISSFVVLNWVLKTMRSSK